MTLPSAAPELASLDLFCSVVELGSLGRAARRHGVSQPSASARVRGLERQLGVTLLQRTPTGSEPTPEGLLVAEWSARVLAAAGDLQAGVALLRAGQTQTLRVVASNTVAEFLLPGWLIELHRVHTDTQIRVEVTNSSRVLEAVRASEVELGFVESPGALRGVRSHQVAVDTLVLVVGRGHPWARRRRPVAAEQLAATPLVTREPGSGTRDALDAALAAMGLAARPPALELGSSSAVKAAVAAGEAPTVISELAVAAEVGSGALVVVPMEGLDLQRPLRAVWSGRGRPAGAAGTLLEVALSASAASSTSDSSPG